MRLLQKACSDGRAIASRTVNQQGAIFRKLSEAIRELRKWNAGAAGNGFFRALARRADVEKLRRLGRAEDFRGASGAVALRSRR